MGTSRWSGWFRAVPLLTAAVHALAAPTVPLCAPRTTRTFGVYEVTNDIVASSGPVLTISGVVGKVEIDLGGYTRSTAVACYVIWDSEILAAQNDGIFLEEGSTCYVGDNRVNNAGGNCRPVRVLTPCPP